MGDLVEFPFGLMALAGVLGLTFGIWLRGLCVPAEKRRALWRAGVERQLAELRNVDHAQKAEIKKLNFRLRDLER